MEKSMLYKCKHCDKLLDSGHDCLDCLKKTLKIEEKIPNLNLTIIGKCGEGHKSYNNEGKF